MPMFTFIYYFARRKLQGKDENYIEKQFRKNPNINLSINFRLEAI